MRQHSACKTKTDAKLVEFNCMHVGLFLLCNCANVNTGTCVCAWDICMFPELCCSAMCYAAVALLAVASRTRQSSREGVGTHEKCNMQP